MVKIISGGQTGVDQAALIAAKSLGLETGGWMPKGWITQGGPRPEFNGLYNMREHSSGQYPPRTYANVRDSDMTLRLAVDFSTSGERCTLKAIKQYRKPYLDIQLKYNYSTGACLSVPDETIKFAAFFIRTHNVLVLNVAGNAERRHLGIHRHAVKVLTQLFECLCDSTAWLDGTPDDMKVKE